MENEIEWSVCESEQTKGMWFMMENEAIIKVKYGIRGKKMLEEICRIKQGKR